jgi:hypothetical protein
MSAVEADPVGVIIPRFVAWLVRFRERQPAMHSRVDIVVSFAVPRMAFGNADISASEAKPIMNDDPLMTSV